MKSKKSLSMSNKYIDKPNMVHYSQGIHFNTLFRNKTFMLIKLRQVCELLFNGNGSTK